MEKEKLKYSDLLDLVQRIAEDPCYAHHKQEFIEIVTIIANYVKLVHEIKNGRAYLDKRRDQIGAPIRTFEEVLKNG